MRFWNSMQEKIIPMHMGTPGKDRGAHSEGEGEVMIAPAATKPKRPPMYKVILLNDDYTPMDFVVRVIMEIFHRSQAEAVELMLAVHHHGSAIVGVYTRDVAETKSEQVVEAARISEYPLQCALEPNG